ncbi:hypothetical protein AMTRI_Chr06g178900 [Amborella trichopoda]|uniref:Thioredoxin domain-containing protein n=1 Tax=Amborella trichopoda TaxID=13333 RepID=U5DHZ5_AMBTC|nr:uncharacterized protein LOC18448588 [Amborella trichopoda]ERN20178.1 hypothetical protein AMTR_s00066p00107860 [Amborella trichopoda]|eukprot:XP_006858711.1 uncharacterized protein LOC18448588 [Amborella trichopoda]
MELHYPLGLQSSLAATLFGDSPNSRIFYVRLGNLPLNKHCGVLNSRKGRSFHSLNVGEQGLRSERMLATILRANKEINEAVIGDAKNSKEEAHENDSSSDDDESDGSLLDEEERREMRRIIREVISRDAEIENDEDEDPDERRKKVERLLADYPLVVNEEDPDWPEDADGWGFNFDQFFNKITIKNVKKDDEDYDSEKEVEWQDDDYIRPIRDITTKEWEVTVFKDISPLIILLHNRYKRPQENEKARNELEKAVRIFWDSRLPSPRCVAIDAVVEVELANALKVSKFPQIIFTKAGKILHRNREIFRADDLSKMMAFFYYGAAKPPCLEEDGQGENIPPPP